MPRGLRAAYGRPVGTEVWALIALALVLTVYLVPVLVRRREVLGYARTQDRYSAALRLLATSGTRPGDSEVCGQRGHAQIFQRPPEVRAMNRPAVRHVRALRTERELERARQAHARASAARRTAANRRLIVACALLGVLVGVAVVAAVTILPWWPVLIPAAALAASMTAGRQAAVASAAADRREVRRINALREELRRLGIEPNGRVTDRDEAAPPVELAAQDRAAEAETEVPEPLEAGADVTIHEAEAASGESAAHERAEVAAVGAAAEELDAAAQTGASMPADPARTAHGAPEPSASEDFGKAGEPAAPATPPQGWRPVQVPAPTYTLVAAARGRKIEELGAVEGDQSASAPVPARPTAARPVAPAPATPAVHPIDLDAVLARRRAAGE